ncbi:putative P-loop containing nucleoside triphosphate hydrolase [Dioscorea sansibarensis]
MKLWMTIFYYFLIRPSRFSNPQNAAAVKLHPSLFAMDPATLVSTVGIFASPALQVALDRLIAYLSKDQPSHSVFDDDLQRLRLSMSNIPALARAAESTPSPDAGLLDLLRQLKDASHSANDLLDDLEYHSIHLQAQSYTPLSIPSLTFESQPSRARSAPVRDAVAGDSCQESVIAPVDSPLSLALDAIRAFSWGKAVRVLSGGSSFQIPADRSGAPASLPDPSSSSSTTISSTSTSIASSSQATQPPVPPQILLPRASEYPSSSSQSKTGLLQQQEITYRQTVGERIIKTAEKLELIASRLEKSISLEKLTSDLIGRSEGQNHHLSSSVVIQQEVFGRDFEREMLVNKLLESEHLERLSILPVLGIGGVGKTTLAQYVFNDKRIEEHFEPRVWICVSYHFDRLMIMRELVAYTSPSKEKYLVEGIGLDGLERKLKENLEGKRFLLVLDDLWTNEWVRLLPALQSGDGGSKILITAREEKIVDRKVRRNKFVLKGLRSDDYWVFFKKCAFGDDDAEKQHPKLLSIGKQIAEKLQGSPLAAKTMGRLLSENLNDQHWTSILKSNVWELGEGAGDIMPVLKLSYMHLPPQLQRCFAYCSIFPKDYRYEVDKLVQIWIAQGLILMSTHT